MPWNLQTVNCGVSKVMICWFDAYFVRSEKCAIRRKIDNNICREYEIVIPLQMS